MLEEHNKRDKKHLISLIGRRSNKTPNFALLIGAGTSASSGIKTSSQMIAERRQQLYEQIKNKIPFDTWLQKQDWVSKVNYPGLEENPYHELGKKYQDGGYDVQN